jgi:hypothetical protein
MPGNDIGESAALKSLPERRTFSIKPWTPPGGNEREPPGEVPLDRGGFSTLNVSRTRHLEEKQE